MFKLKRPCKTCPFKIGVGSQFNLHTDRLEEIRNASAFQCHGTVDYESGPEDDNCFPLPQPGTKPQQCAGLMSILHRTGQPNQIMQVAERIGGISFNGLDPDKEAYRTWAAVLNAHGRGREPRNRRTVIVKVKINGKEQDIEDRVLAYEHIVTLAGKTGTPSVTWDAPDSPGGILIPGSTVLVKDGLSLSVHHTGNA